MKSDFWVVVPAFNEEKVITSTLRELLQFATQVIVVDDASTDNTVQEASSLPVTILQHPINLGQGAALQTGISYALDQGADFIVTFDADGQHLPNEIASMIEPLTRGECDITLGSRFLDKLPENLPPFRRVVLRAAATFTNWTTGLRLTDAANGFRAFNRKAATSIRICQNRMAHASEILGEIRRHHLRYKEVAVTIRYTQYTLAKGQRLTNSINIFWDLTQGRIKK